MAAWEASQSQRSASAVERLSLRNASSAPRRSGGVARGVQRREAVEQEIGCAGGMSPERRRARSVGDIPRARCDGEVADEHRRTQRIQIGLPGERCIKRLESLGRLEQDRRNVLALAESECDLGVQAVGLRALELIESSDLRCGEQLAGGIQSARLEFGLGGRQKALWPACGIACQRGGAFQEGGGGREPAARLRSAGRALELLGDALFRFGRGRGSMPGTAIGIRLGIGDFGERTVHRPPLRRRGGPVDRRARERMAEPHPPAEREQARRLGRLRSVCSDSQPCGRAPEQHRVADRLRRGEQQQTSTVAR